MEEPATWCMQHFWSNTAVRRNRGERSPALSPVGQKVLPIGRVSTGAGQMAGHPEYSIRLRKSVAAGVALRLNLLKEAVAIYLPKLLLPRTSRMTLSMIRSTIAAESLLACAYTNKR